MAKARAYRFPKSKVVVPFATWMRQAPRSEADQALYWGTLRELLRFMPDAPVCAEDRAALQLMPEDAP